MISETRCKVEGGRGIDGIAKEIAGLSLNPSPESLPVPCGGKGPPNSMVALWTWITLVRWPLAPGSPELATRPRHLPVPSEIN